MNNTNNTDNTKDKKNIYENAVFPEKLMKKSDRLLLHREKDENETKENYHDVM